MNPDVTELVRGIAFGVPGGVPVVVGLAILLAAVAVLGVRDAWREKIVRARWALAVMRVLGALGAWALAAQPEGIRERTVREPGRLLLLADVSRSMAVAPDGHSRAQAARGLFERWASDPAAARTTVVAFGDGARPARLSDLARAWPTDDDATRLSRTLAEEAQTSTGIGAVLVVSDGNEQPRVAALTPHIRVHAVAIGGADTLHDDAVVRVEPDARVFLHEQAKVRVLLRSSGLERRSIGVDLLSRTDRIAHRDVLLDASGRGETELTFSADRLGRAAYRVVIALAPGDDVPENNERAFLVRVVRDRLRVLHLVGRPTWDERFLRAFLKRDPTLDLVSFFILRSATDLTMSSPDELALIPFPTDELFREHLGSFDVLLLQNFDYAPYHMDEYLPRIRDYVRAGGSLAMIGGDLSFTGGGYASTPVGEALPVRIPVAPPTSPDAFVLGEFSPVLVSEGARHPVVGLADDPARNASAWSSLAPLEGANRVLGLVPGAQALLEHPTARGADGRPMPVLSVGTFGRGRTLAFAADTSWRWGMTTAAHTGDPSAYERFWDRALRWLARDPALDPSRLETDRERYTPGVRVHVEGLLRDAHYVPIADAPVRLVVLGADRRPIDGRSAETDPSGQLRVDISAPHTPGVYELGVLPPSGDTLIASEWIVVEAGGDELADPHSDPSYLRELCARTGGTFIEDPARAPSLASFDASRVTSRRLSRDAPFATPWAFAVLAALLIGDWALRRRWGLR